MNPNVLIHSYLSMQSNNEPQSETIVDGPIELASAEQVLAVHNKLGAGEQDSKTKPKGPTSEQMAYTCPMCSRGMIRYHSNPPKFLSCPYCKSRTRSDGWKVISVDAAAERLTEMRRGATLHTLTKQGALSNV